MTTPTSATFTALPIPPSLLGESPLWHPIEQQLYWCDIPGKQLNCYNPNTGTHRQWPMESEPGCCAAVEGGGLLVALRHGLMVFDPDSGTSRLLCAAPYDARVERFNDGKADAQGRFWVGTIYEPRDAAMATLYCFNGQSLVKKAGDITTSNGLAWSPDGGTLYWADTKAHRIQAFDFDSASGKLSRPRLFREFSLKLPEQNLNTYGGRPDGATVDAEGCYWVAMFEGARLLRLSPAGETLIDLALPVRCPTMPCFGGADLKTLYITTSRENRPADELAREPLAGSVLTIRVEVPGVPTAMVKLENRG